MLKAISPSALQASTFSSMYAFSTLNMLNNSIRWKWSVQKQFLLLLLSAFLSTQTLYLPCNILNAGFCMIFQKIIHIFIVFIVIVIIVIIIQQNKGLIFLKVCLKESEWTVNSYIILLSFYYCIIGLKHNKQKCLVLHTVIPSFDFRASSITVVVAVR